MVLIIVTALIRNYEWISKLLFWLFLSPKPGNKWKFLFLLKEIKIRPRSAFWHYDQSQTTMVLFTGEQMCQR